jgi:group I intron endonuclease
MEILNKPGIYLIYNLANQRVYVGQSRNVRKRFSRHRGSLLLGNHKNPHLQSAFNHYGEDKFVFRSVEYCEIENLTEREEYWIGQFNSMNRNRGYNLVRAKTNGGHSEETKAKLSAINKGKTHSEEAKAKMSESQKGRIHSEETRAKMGASRIGKALSEDHRAKMSKAHKGKVISEETREKLREARKGKTLSEEHRAKLSAAQKARQERQRLALSDPPTCLYRR